MKFLHSFALTSALVVCPAGALHAQDSQSTPAQRAQAEKLYRQKVVQSVFENCNRTAPIKNAKDKVQACECYAKVYNSRYTLSELLAINKWSAESNNKKGIIALLLVPEAVKCKVIIR